MCRSTIEITLACSVMHPQPRRLVARHEKIISYHLIVIGLPILGTLDQDGSITIL
jgi:hypothetical protein